MAQEKRLTRSQKVILADVVRGHQPSRNCNDDDIKVLADRGLICMDAGKWGSCK